MTIKVSWDVDFWGFLASWTKVADELLATNLAKRGASTQLVATLCISAEKGQTREEREREREKERGESWEPLPSNLWNLMPLYQMRWSNQHVCLIMFYTLSFRRCSSSCRRCGTSCTRAMLGGQIRGACFLSLFHLLECVWHRHHNIGSSQRRAVYILHIHHLSI